jgi:uncharacterized protein with ATP-grasp and redox domains
MEGFHMFIHPECIPCILKVRLQEMEMIGLGEDLKLKAVGEIVRYLLENADEEADVTFIATNTFRIVKKITGNMDPYRSLKIKSNSIALSLLPHVKRYVDESGSDFEAFRRACIASVIGNAIDFGVAEYRFSFRELEMLNASLSIDDVEYVLKLLKPGASILYLLDNAGEVLFDTLLLEKIRCRNVKTVGVVKSGAFQNDVTVEDIKSLDLHSYFDEIVETGTDGSSIFLWEISERLLRRLNDADLIISKGMANYEYLSNEVKIRKPIFYLLKAKCSIVAETLGVPHKSYVAKLDLR